MNISDEVVFLETAFDVLNKRFFECALSIPAITIQSTRKSRGHFTTCDAWDDSGQKLKEINLGAEALRRPVSDIIATLLHEMVHYWCYMQGIQDTSRNGTYHNKRFKVEAEKRGLIITYDSHIGYSITQLSPEMLSFVHEMGWEDKHKLYRVREAAKKSSTRKYVCPCCGLSVRATKTVRIACINCGNVEMVTEQNAAK